MLGTLLISLTGEELMSNFVLLYFVSSHWYLAVICFAGHENPTYVNEINDDDDEPDNKVQFAVNLEIFKLVIVRACDVFLWERFPLESQLFKQFFCETNSQRQ